MKPRLTLLAGCLLASVAHPQADVVAAKPRFVVYEAAADVPDVPELWRTNQKTGQVLKLSDSPVPGGGLHGRAIDPKGRYVVYRADLDTDGVNEVYRSTLKAGKQLKLSGPMDPEGFAVTHVPVVDPKGRYAVYVAEQDEAGVTELYRSRLKDGQWLKLSGPLVAGGDVDEHVQLDPTGKYAIYLADQETDGTTELYRSRLKTGEVLKLNDALPPGCSVGDCKIDPQGKYVLFSVLGPTPFSGTLFKASLVDAQPVQLSGAAVAGGGVMSWQLHAERGAASYVGDMDVDGVYELYWIDLASGENTKLSGPLVADGDVQTGWRLDDQHDAVLYVADADEAGVDALYRADLLTGEVDKVSGPAMPWHGFQLDPAGGHAVYTALASLEGPVQVWSTSLADLSPLDVTGPLVDGGSVATGGGDVPYGLAFDAEGRFVVFAADADAAGVVELYRSDLATGERVKLSPPLAEGELVSPFVLDPLGRHALFLVMTESGGSPTSFFRSEVETGEVLVLEPVDGLGSSPLGWSFDPEGRYVYRLGDFDTPGTAELYRYDLQSGERVKLSPPLVPGGGVIG